MSKVRSVHVLLIDNTDSFTELLAALVRSLGVSCSVLDARQGTLQDIKKMSPSHIILSPGPGHPKDAKLSNAILRAYHKGELPILGVCLGHQCMAYTLGDPSLVSHARIPMHGKTSMISHDGTSIFRRVSSPFSAARYHSLIVKAPPKNFRTIAFSGRGKEQEIMAMAHERYPIIGVQFHPESCVSEWGKKLMKNFLSLKPS